MTDRLAPGDKLYWWPNRQVLGWLSDLIPAGSKVLDIGPNQAPFFRATVLADIQPCTTKMEHQEFVQCEVGAEPLPFPDKHFDFVYCRHTLEDMADPFSAMREIERVGYAGYIETPSPIAELCRAVDGSAPPWRGYNHHRWIVWAHEGELRFVTKFPAVEYVDVEALGLADLLRRGPHYWNTYHLWRDRIAFVHREVSRDFEMPTGYPPLLIDAVNQSRAATDAFWKRLPQAAAPRAA